MKKIVLSLAGVMAAVAFAPEASALPVFARQTGMACSACHFQHFPMLNGFGRAFKAAGFTMMGAQGKVEEGTSLSIPAELNMAVLTSMGYEKSNMTANTAAVAGNPMGKNTGNGAIFVPGVAGEASLFFGGRVSENAGFLSELGLGGAAAALGSAKLPMLWEVADGTRAGVVPFATDAQGASYGMELLNTGANAVHQQSNTPGFNGAHANAISAQMYINTGGFADGAALVATNDSWFANLTKFQQTGIASGTFAALGSTYIRGAAMFDLSGWDSAVGVQSWSGQSLIAFNGGAVATPLVAAVPAGGGVISETKATAIDGQMQGTMGGMPVGFYFSYANAPKPTNGMASTYNTNAAGAVAAFSRSALNINGEVGIVPEVATLGAGVRMGKSGVDEGALKGLAANGTNASDNALFLTATYKVQQNMLARLSYTHNSGGYWFSNAANTGTTNTIGANTATVNLYVLF